MAKKLTVKAMEELADDMCSSLPESKRPRARELAINLLFLERKLDEARRQALTQPAVCEYDNGGGQSGTRVSPWVQAYGQLLKSYGAALKQFEEQFASDGDKQEETSPLAMMRSNLAINRAAYKRAKAS
jgi:hypothetical protein